MALGLRCAGLLSLLLVACDEDGRRFVPPPGTEGEETSEPSAAPPSGRSYLLVNEDGTCEFFWVEGEARSDKRRRPCPREVAPGEKVRLTGRTCMRESSDPARNVPVRCPRELYKAAEADDQDAGPYRLPASD